MYLTHKNLEQYWVADLEADDLEATKIWCVCVKNCKTEEEITFLDAKTFNTWYQEDKRILVGHNFLAFDGPTLDRVWSSGIDYTNICDTFILSLLYNPALDGGHSLKSWGLRLQFPKLEYNDWSKLSDEMIRYCQEDVRLTWRLFRALTNKMRRMKYSELSCQIEHQIKIIIEQQTKNGFYFDRDGAINLRSNLRLRQSDLTTQIQKLFPPVRSLVKTNKFRRTKDGGTHASYQKALQRHHDVVYRVEEIDGVQEELYDCYDLEEFNIGSPKQRVEKLLSLGWVPTKFTKKGFPRVDEETLLLDETLSKIPEVAAIAEWLVLQGRSSMLDTWLNYCGEDSRIHGRVNSCGASTRRMVHSQPNSANIPSGAKAKYGHECRALWQVTPNEGLIQVGVDAAGLENVGLLHYLNNPKAVEILGRKKPNDVHSLNARELSEALGREIDREWGAKTSFFALVFGAYPPKLGQIVKGPESDGQIVYDTIVKNVPGLKELIERAQSEYRRNNGRLRTIDNGLVLCPSLNAALNYLVQSSGAIVMKLACILLFEEAKKIGLWFRLLGTIHDEFQMETKTKDGERLGKLAVSCIEEAARRLKFNVPLSGEFKLGYNWDQCH